MKTHFTSPGFSSLRFVEMAEARVEGCREGFNVEVSSTNLL
jgi:hypothetical protein